MLSCRTIPLFSWFIRLGSHAFGATSFFDPYIALKEAYRVLNESSKLTIGLALTGEESSLLDKGSVSSLLSGIKKKKRDESVIQIFRSIVSRLSHQHMFHWRYDDLLDLIRKTGFSG